MFRKIYYLSDSLIHKVLKMVEFETLKSEDIRFGTNNFIEVARKKAIDEDQENIFLSIARGYYTPEDEKRYRKNFSVPVNKDLVDFIVKYLPEMLEEED